MVHQHILTHYFRDFTAVYDGDTSRIIRASARIYVIRIAVVSQEHVPVCITRKIHGPKITWF